MKLLLIIYHSQSGSTRKLAEAVAKGASQEADIELRLLRAMEASAADLIAADAVIFGTPENLGYISGGLKDFFDRSFYPAESHQLNIPYAVFISCGNDGSGALRQIETIARGYPLRKVAEPVICCGEIDQKAIATCTDLGAALAAGLALGIF
ncbi:MAG: multimeric flavodoxin WrbA [Oceanicoccus sp.]|jgi:multimeric flavodoxin WrbA